MMDEQTRANLIETGIDPDQDKATLLMAMAEKMKNVAKALEIEFDLPHPNYRIWP